MSKCPRCGVAIAKNAVGAEICPACGLELSVPSTANSVGDDTDKTMQSDEFLFSGDAESFGGSPTGFNSSQQETGTAGIAPADSKSPFGTTQIGTIGSVSNVGPSRNSDSHNSDNTRTISQNALAENADLKTSGEDKAENSGGQTVGFDASDDDDPALSATFQSDEFAVDDETPDGIGQTVALNQRDDSHESATFLSDEFALSDELPPPQDQTFALNPQDDSHESKTFLSDEFALSDDGFSGPDQTMAAGDPADPHLSATFQSDEFLLADETPMRGMGNTVDINRDEDPNLSATFQSDEFSIGSAGDDGRTVDASRIINSPIGRPRQPERFDLSSHDDSMNVTADLDGSGNRKPRGTLPSADFSLEAPGQTADISHDDDDDPASVQTFLSEDLPEGQAKTMQANWGGVIGGRDKQHMSLKGAEIKSTGKPSGLYISQRKLAEPKESPEKKLRTDYDLIRVLGEGGMGVVYDARQTSVARSVAVKMLKSKTAKDVRQQSKFLAEAVVTGDLDHPNIVPIYDVGRTESGLLFYAMKKVQGTPWMKALKEKSQSENVEILMKVGDALAFAHSRGVIHRDLKPENVMLGDYGEVLVMDWGLALTAPEFQKSASITASNSMGGTPAYMAPEMATGPLDNISFRSDVYLMGAILFEILTGKPPHTGKNTMNCLLAAVKNEIRPTEVTGELMSIARKAMASQAADRYQTVLEFQQAIREYQSHGESITLAARAESDLKTASETGEYRNYSRAVFGYEEALALWSGNDRARQGLTQSRLKYAECAFAKEDFDLGLSLVSNDERAHDDIRQRLSEAQSERRARVKRLAVMKKAAVGMAAAIFGTISTGLYVANNLREKAEFQRLEAVKQTEIAETEQKKAENAEKVAREQEKAATAAKVTAEEQKKKAEDAEAEAVTQRMSAEDQKMIAVQQKDKAEEAESRAIAQQRIAENARVAQEYEAYVAQIGLAAAQIDENAFVAARTILEECNKDLRDWEWGRLKFLSERSWRSVQTTTRLDAVAVSPDGKRFVTCGWNGQAQVWNAETGQAVGILRHSGRQVHAAAFSPDGMFVVTVGDDRKGQIRLWKAESLQLVHALDGHSAPVTSVAFLSDSSRFVTGSQDNSVRLWSVNSKNSVIVGKQNGAVWSVAASPVDDRIASAGQDGLVVVWSLADKTSSIRFTGHSGPVYAVAFSPDGKFTASGGHDKNVLLWKPADIQPVDFDKLVAGRYVEPPAFVSLSAHRAPVRGIQFSADGKELATAGQDNIVNVWNTESHKVTDVLRGHGETVRSCAFGANSRILFSASYDGSARIWDRNRYAPDQRVLDDQNLQGHRDAVMGVAFDPASKRVVTASRDRKVMVWNRQTGQIEKPVLEEGHDYLASNAVFSRNGKRAFTAAADNTVRSWDLDSGVETHKFEHTGRSAAVAFANHNGWLLTGSDQSVKPTNPGDGDSTSNWALQVWKIGEKPTQSEMITPVVLAGHRREITAIAISPNETLAASADVSGVVLIWNTSDWSIRYRLSGHVGKVTALRFANESTLLSSSVDKTVAYWSMDKGGEDKSRILKHPDGVSSFAVSNDKRYAVTACNDGKIRRWEVSNPSKVQVVASTDPGANVAVDIWESRLLTMDSASRSVRVWDLESLAEIRFPKTNGQAGSFLEFDSKATVLWNACFAPGGESVMTIGGDECRVWDAQTALPRLSLNPTNVIATARFSPQGDQIVTSSWDNSARIWSVQTGKPIVKLSGSRDGDSSKTGSDSIGHSARVNEAAFSPNGAYVISAGDDKIAILWDAKTGKVIRRFEGHTGSVRSVVFSPDGTLVLTASSDTTARLWNVATGEMLRELTGHSQAINRAVFSPDGSFLATGSEDNTARIYETASGKSPAGLKPLIGHTAAIKSLVFLPNFRKLESVTTDSPSDKNQDKERADQPNGQAPQFAFRLVTGSADNLVKIWDPLRAKEILTLRGHTQEITAVDAAPDGSAIVTSSRDGSAIIWQAADWKTDTATNSSAPLDSNAPWTAKAQPKNATIGFQPAVGLPAESTLP